MIEHALLNPSDNRSFCQVDGFKKLFRGVSEFTYPSMIVMRSIFDFLIIETVGVGQSETFIKDISDSVILCIQPGSGDTVQFMKSGIFEIPDLIVITKTDLNNLSDITYADLSGSKSYFQNKNEWDISIIKTSSSKNYGFGELYSELISRWKWLNSRKD